MIKCQWDPNIQILIRNDQFQRQQQYPHDLYLIGDHQFTNQIPQQIPYQQNVARMHYPRDPIEQDRCYDDRPQQFDHNTTNTRYVPDTRSAYKNGRPNCLDYRDSNSKSDRKPVSLPKSLPYNGTTSLAAFYAKFSGYADSKNLTAKQCEDHLYWCLEGEAGEYFRLIMAQGLDLEYYDLIQKLEKKI